MIGTEQTQNTLLWEIEDMLKTWFANPEAIMEDLEEKRFSRNGIVEFLIDAFLNKMVFELTQTNILILENEGMLGHSKRISAEAVLDLAEVSVETFRINYYIETLIHRMYNEEVSDSELIPELHRAIRQLLPGEKTAFKEIGLIVSSTDDTHMWEINDEINIRKMMETNRSLIRPPKIRAVFDLNANDSEVAPNSIMSRDLEEFINKCKNALVVMVITDFGGKIDDLEIIEKLLENGVKVVSPLPLIRMDKKRIIELQKKLNAKKTGELELLADFFQVRFYNNTDISLFKEQVEATRLVELEISSRTTAPTPQETIRALYKNMN